MNAAEELRSLAQRGVGFDMNPTMMFDSMESLWRQWHDYFARLDEAWRERVAAAADALSSPPADDVREALAVEAAARAIFSGYVGETPGGFEKRTYAYDREKAERVARRALAAAAEVRPYGTVTEPTDEDVERMRAVLNAADVDYSAREQRADAGGGEMEPGDWFAFLARAVLRAGAEAPHETVTDTEVENASEKFAASILVPERETRLAQSAFLAGVEWRERVAREARS